MKKTIRLTETELIGVIKSIVNEQLTLAAINNQAMVNNVAYKLKAWAGGLLGYQPVQVKGLTINKDGTATIKWKYESALMNDSGTDIIPKADVDRIFNELKTKSEIKFELPNGKTVKLVKA